MTQASSSENSEAREISNVSSSGDRVDFIKRLFAVSVSVGFASQIARILLDPLNINSHEINILSIVETRWKFFTLLIISLIAVISSWEGYLRAVAIYKLEDTGRFIVDVIIVLLYLVLLLSSQYYTFWFFLLPTIFFLYVIWDILRARTPTFKSLPPRSAYGNSRNTSFVWFIFFLLLAAIENSASSLGFAASASIATFGLLIYRNDNIRRGSWLKKALYLIPSLVAVVMVNIL